jgi:hypothetical protein
MATYEFDYDGKTLEFDSPLPPAQARGLQAQLIAKYDADKAASLKAHQEKSSLLRAGLTGFQGTVGETVRGAGDFFNSDYLRSLGNAATAMAEGEYEAPDERDTGIAATLRKGYKGYGLDKLAQGIGGVAPMMALGAASPAAAVGAWGTQGLFGGTAQAVDQQQHAGMVPDADRARLAGVATGILYGAIGPLLNTFAGVGQGTLKTIAPELAAKMGPTAEALAAKVLTGEITADVAKAQLSTAAANFMRATGGAAAVGAGLSVGSTAINMGQAGQDITGPEARKRYEEGAIDAAFLAPAFGLHGAWGRRGKQEESLDRSQQVGQGQRDQIAREQQEGVIGSREYQDADNAQFKAALDTAQKQFAQAQTVNSKDIADKAERKEFERYRKDLHQQIVDMQTFGPRHERNPVTAEERAAAKAELGVTGEEGKTKFGGTPEEIIKQSSERARQAAADKAEAERQATEKEAAEQAAATQQAQQAEWDRRQAELDRDLEKLRRKQDARVAKATTAEEKASAKAEAERENAEIQQRQADLKSQTAKLPEDPNTRFLETQQEAMDNPPPVSIDYLLSQLNKMPPHDPVNAGKTPTHADSIAEHIKSVMAQPEGPPQLTREQLDAKMTEMRAKPETMDEATFENLRRQRDALAKKEERANAPAFDFLENRRQQIAIQDQLTRMNAQQTRHPTTGEKNDLSPEAAALRDKLDELRAARQEAARDHEDPHIAQQDAWDAIREAIQESQTGTGLPEANATVLTKDGAVPKAQHATDAAIEAYVQAALREFDTHASKPNPDARNALENQLRGTLKRFVSDKMKEYVPPEAKDDFGAAVHGADLVDGGRHPADPRLPGQMQQKVQLLLDQQRQYAQNYKDALEKAHAAQREEDAARQRGEESPLGATSAAKLAEQAGMWAELLRKHTESAEHQAAVAASRRDPLHHVRNLLDSYKNRAIGIASGTATPKKAAEAKPRTKGESEGLQLSGGVATPDMVLAMHKERVKQADEMEVQEKRAITELKKELAQHEKDLKAIGKKGDPAERERLQSEIDNLTPLLAHLEQGLGFMERNKDGTERLRKGSTELREEATALLARYDRMQKEGNTGEEREPTRQTPESDLNAQKNAELDALEEMIAQPGRSQESVGRLKKQLDQLTRGGNQSPLEVFRVAAIERIKSILQGGVPISSEMRATLQKALNLLVENKGNASTRETHLIKHEGKTLVPERTVETKGPDGKMRKVTVPAEEMEPRTTMHDKYTLGLMDAIKAQYEQMQRVPSAERLTKQPTKDVTARGRERVADETYLRDIQDAIRASEEAAAAKREPGTKLFEDSDRQGDLFTDKRETVLGTAAAAKAKKLYQPLEKRQVHDDLKTATEVRESAERESQRAATALERLNDRLTDTYSPNVLDSLPKYLRESIAQRDDPAASLSGKWAAGNRVRNAEQLLKEARLALPEAKKRAKEAQKALKKAIDAELEARAARDAEVKGGVKPLPEAKAVQAQADARRKAEADTARTELTDAQKRKAEAERVAQAQHDAWQKAKTDREAAVNEARKNIVTRGVTNHEQAVQAGIDMMVADAKARRDELRGMRRSTKEGSEVPEWAQKPAQKGKAQTKEERAASEALAREAKQRRHERLTRDLQQGEKWPTPGKSSMEQLADNVRMARETVERRLRQAKDGIPESPKAKAEREAEIEYLQGLLSEARDLGTRSGKEMRELKTAIFGLKGVEYAMQTLKKHGNAPDPRRPGERMPAKEEFVAEDTVDIKQRKAAEALDSEQRDKFEKRYGVTPEQYAGLQQRAARGNERAKAKLAELSKEIDTTAAEREMVAAEDLNTARLKERLIAAKDKATEKRIKAELAAHEEEVKARRDALPSEIDKLVEKANAEYLKSTSNVDAELLAHVKKVEYDDGRTLKPGEKLPVGTAEEALNAVTKKIDYYLAFLKCLGA